jgi:glycogen debranching enzyme
MVGTWSFGDTATGRGSPAAAPFVLVEGDSFCISSLNGDIELGTVQGLFDRDTRFLSQFELLINESPVEHLSTLPSTPFSGGILGRVRPQAGRADSTMLVFRHRYVGQGMREDILLRNLALEPAAVTLTILIDVDFAHLFEVKEQRIVARGERKVRTAGSSIVYDYAWRDLRRGVRIVLGADGVAASEGVLNTQVVVPARGEWSACLQVTPSMDEGPLEPHYQCGEPVESAVPLRRLERWKRSTPNFRSGHEGFNRMVSRGEEDLGALRIFDPEDPERAVVAAGAPWFMTLFGRDSLITAWMALLADPTLAVGTLRTLARYQGTKVDPRAEEQPGRIPHELRWGLARSLARGSGSLYYGSVDATPLFVMLLGEVRRWGLANDVVEELLPHADRALAWITEYGDRDGDGYVEYHRATDQGLVNQGWKDSWDGISFANGRLPQAPIALCEVQGYVYAAYLARAHFAREAGDMGAAHRWADAAMALKAAFNRDFWLPDEGFFAVGLDADKKPIDSITSNVGHCLWTGIIDEDKAPAVAERLMAPDLFTGFGVRTLSTQMGAYNPVSYHNGSVWPHDNAVIAAGLMRYGFVDSAHQIAMGLVDTAEAFGDRLPELFSGLSRHEFPLPVPYPTACSPQAWAAAAPLLLVRTMLRLDPWIPRLTLWLTPDLPEQLGDLTVANIPLGVSRMTVTVRQGKTDLTGLARDVVVVDEPRHPGHEAFVSGPDSGGETE